MIKKIFILVSITIIFTACNIQIKSNAVNPDEYLSKKENPIDIYKKNIETNWINPFNFSHTDFGRLILVSIDNHPEIKTVELVVQNNDKGAFVVVYYHNGSVETYPNRFLSIDKKYLQPNNDWKLMKKQDFKYVFEKTKNRLILNLDIIIKKNTHIFISVNNNSFQAKQYSFLAAVGADLSDVKRFPLIYLRQAGFLPLNDTKIDIRINDIAMKPTKVPIKVENLSCYKTVYSFSPQAFFWNEEQDTTLNLTTLKKIKTQSDNPKYFTTLNNRHSKIKTIVYKTNKHAAKYNFMPEFPDINALKEGVDLMGKFTIDIDEIEGVIGGIYKISKQNNKIEIYFEPEKCWQPMPGKDWVSAYKYKAVINQISNKQYHIKSEWTIN